MDVNMILNLISAVFLLIAAIMLIMAGINLWKVRQIHNQLRRLTEMDRYLKASGEREQMPDGI